MTSRKFSRGALGVGIFALVIIGLAEFGGHPRAQLRGKGVPPPARFVPRRILVKFRAGTSAERVSELLAMHRARAERALPQLDVQVLALPENADEGALARGFRMRPEVEFAELDRIHPAQQMAPNDPLYPAWHLQKINAPEAWAFNTGSGNVTIAILDTGIENTHEDLASKLVVGWNVYNNNADTSDVHGHGTAVAGVAAAASDNGVGVTSVAWGCRIMPVRVSDLSGNASESAIASGLTWAADHGARVANVSYYVTGSRTVSNAAKYFQGKGGIVTVAAGNYGTVETAQDDPYVLTVGATDPQDSLYYWSNRGSNLDLVAPGNNSTTLRGGLYGAGGGTSIAAPVVAGVAALVLSSNPSLTPRQVQDIMKQNADDLGPAGWDATYGSGRINAGRAVSAAAQSGSDVLPPSVQINSPGAGATVSNVVNIEVAARDNVGVVKNELYVDGRLVASSTSAPFTVRWNARKAARGAHELKCIAYDAPGNAGESTPVTVYK